jgi:hypothetical protein
MCVRSCTEAQFIVPGWGYEVDYCIGFCRTGPSGYRGWRAGTKIHAIVDFSPQSGTKNLATVHKIWFTLVNLLVLEPSARILS